jgi:hypothetical protein
MFPLSVYWISLVLKATIQIALNRYFHPVFLLLYHNANPLFSYVSTSPTRSCNSSSTTTRLHSSKKNTRKRRSIGSSLTLEWIHKSQSTLLKAYVHPPLLLSIFANTCTENSSRYFGPSGRAVGVPQCYRPNPRCQAPHTLWQRAKSTSGTRQEAPQVRGAQFCRQVAQLWHLSLCRYDFLFHLCSFLLLMFCTGTVSYDVTNWLEKNKDPLQPDLEACMRDSKNSFVRHLFTEHFEDLPTSLAEYQRKGGMDSLLYLIYTGLMFCLQLRVLHSSLWLLSISPSSATS